MMQLRWTVAGGKKLPFDREAIVEIHRLTGGIARDICKPASEALLRAVVNKGKTVDKQLVSDAAKDAFAEA